MPDSHTSDTGTPPTERTRVKRLAPRGRYDRETIYAIVDEALYCHVGFTLDGRPAVIPTAHWREGDNILIHGHAKAGMLLALRDGADCCVTVTLFDGLVLARTAFHHSVNYRSVVAYGRMTEIADPDEKFASLKYFMDHIAPGRWGPAKPPDALELKATMVLSMPLDEASAKIRSGPPADDAEDMDRDVWAGVVPARLVFGEPETAPDMRLEKPVPDHARHLIRD